MSLAPIVALLREAKSGRHQTLCRLVWRKRAGGPESKKSEERRAIAMGLFNPRRTDYGVLDWPLFLRLRRNDELPLSH